MIQKLSHISIYVLDQDSAYDFYVNKLGMEVRTDARMDNGYRWLTVGPKGQPDLEIVLMPVQAGPMIDAERAATVRRLIQDGTFGVGVLETPDVRQAYEELKAKGVEFMREPTEQFYGIEALVKDDSGNWFSLTQRKN
jgi:catechol 2,3-dioxygenase-like lactoylglutathione lyase family enzyme